MRMGQGHSPVISGHNGADKAGSAGPTAALSARLGPARNAGKNQAAAPRNDRNNWRQLLRPLVGVPMRKQRGETGWSGSAGCQERCCGVLGRRQKRVASGVKKGLWLLAIRRIFRSHLRDARGILTRFGREDRNLPRDLTMVARIFFTNPRKQLKYRGKIYQYFWQYWHVSFYL